MPTRKVVMKTLIVNANELKVLDANTEHDFSELQYFEVSVEMVIQKLIDITVRQFCERSDNSEFIEYYHKRKDNNLPFPKDTRQMNDEDKFAVNYHIGTRSVEMTVNILIRDRYGNVMWETETYIPLA